MGIDRGTMAHNPACDLDFVGHPLLDVSGSFISKSDSGIKCADMVVDVMTSAMHDMYNDGWFAKARDRLFRKLHDNTCMLTGETRSEVLAPLDIQHMGGIFALHFGVSLICIV